MLHQKDTVWPEYAGTLPKILSADFAGVGHIGRIGQGISTPRGAPVIKTREIKTIIIIP